MLPLALATLIVLPALPAQVEELVPDARLEVELHAADPVLVGHGPSRAFEYDVSFAGKLYVWAASTDVDPFLRVTSADGTLVAEDDDSGGGSTACLVLDVAPGTTLFIAVAAADPGSGGTVVLHASEGPETAGTRAAAEMARAARAEIEAAQRVGDLLGARQKIARAVVDPSAVEGGDRSPALAEELWLLGIAAHGVSDFSSARDCWKRTLEFRSRALPDDHPELRVVRQNLAIALASLGDARGARELFAKAVEALSRTLPEDHPDLQAARQDLAIVMRMLGDAHGARALFEAVLEVYSRTLPDDHAALQRARGNLAVTLKQLGDLRGARVLEEQVLAVLSRTLPEDHANLRIAKQNLAGTLAELGDLHGARAIEEQVLAQLSRTVPDDDPNLQRARRNLAITLRELGDLHGSRALAEQALENWSRTLPEDHPDLQSARQTLASALVELGDLHAALELQEQVLLIGSRTLPDDHPDLQSARTNLAITLRDLGDLHRARELEEQVLAVLSRTLPEDHPALQGARQNLAITARELGDLPVALELVERVLAVRERSLPEDHLDLQRARGNVAAVRKALGDLEGARDLEVRVLETFSRTLPEDHPDLQIARQNLANTQSDLGDLFGARELLEQVLEVLSRTMPDDHPLLQGARQNLAVVIEELGDLFGARELEEKVLEVRARTLPDDHPHLQSARQSLASTLEQLGDLDGARALQEKVLEVLSRTLPAEHRDLQVARQELAVTWYRLGDLDAARTLFEEVHAVYVKTLPDDHPDLQTARVNLARVMKDQGELARARELEEKVVAVRSRTLPDDHFDSRRARLNLMRTRAETSDEQGAIEIARALSSGLEEEVALSLGHFSPRELEEAISAGAPEVSMVLSLAAGAGCFERDPELERTAFTVLESRRAVAIAARALSGAAAQDLELVRLAAEERTRADDLARLAQVGANAEEIAAARRELDLARRARMDRTAKDPGARVLLTAPTADALARTLAPDQALVAYSRYTRWWIDHANNRHRAEESLLAFVLRPDAELVRVELGPIEPIERAGAAWRAALGAQDDGASARRGLSGGGDTQTSLPEADAGAELSRVLVAPLLAELEDARRLVVALDDVLHALPFDALPLGDELLGERFALEQHLTLRELLWSRSPLAPGQLVALGGASYDDEPVRSPERDRQLLAAAHSSPLRGSSFERGFAALAHTAEEARGVAALYAEATEGEDRVVVLEGGRASKASLNTLAPTARFLHLATHGWFAPEAIPSSVDPKPLDARLGIALSMSSEARVRGTSPLLLCGLAFAGANRPDALGRLAGLVTAEEIASWDLASCELAVLSACDTNVGVRRAGQGVASLQKALHMAGARSVITSLWKVPDEATKELMVDFYRRLWVEGKAKHQALWEAKLRLRDARGDDGAPLYTTRDWAAWVLTGEPD